MNHSPPAQLITPMQNFQPDQEVPEDALQKHRARLVDAATVIQAMLEIRKEMEADDARAQELGLSTEELAFYDAVSARFGEAYDLELLRGLIHDVAQSIKRNLKVDWTEPHRESVKSAVRAAVERVLLRRKGEGPRTSTRSRRPSWSRRRPCTETGRVSRELWAATHIRGRCTTRRGASRSHFSPEKVEMDIYTGHRP